MTGSLPLSFVLCVLAFSIVNIDSAYADCPDTNSHPVPQEATTVNGHTIIPCHCNPGYSFYHEHCVIRGNLDSMCQSQGGLVYYNNKCRTRNEAEEILENKIRNAAAGANYSLQTFACEQYATLGEMISSHVKDVSAALLLTFSNPKLGIETGAYEAARIAIDESELIFKNLRCSTNDNVRAACQNFSHQWRTVKEAKNELTHIRGLSETSIQPAEPIIKPAEPRNPSLWADPSDPNLGAWCRPITHIQ